MVIAVEGIIGVGKSYFLEKIKDLFKDEVRIYNEGIDERTYKKAVENYYNNRKENAYPFQLTMLWRKASDSAKARKEKDKIAVLERTINSNFEVFCKQCYSTGIIEQWQYEVYKHSYNALKTFVELPDYIIYLNCPTEFAYNRIQKRSRAGENNISFEYLSEMHKLYDTWANYYLSKVHGAEIYYTSDLTDEEIKEYFKEALEEAGNNG